MPGTDQAVAVMTVGGQPQVVTLLLDALYARKERITTLYLIHLALISPRYQEALSKIRAEWRDQHYGDYPCELRTILIRDRGEPVSALDTEEAIDAVRDTFHDLFSSLKEHDAQIHLGLSGGPRLLGHMASAMARQHFKHIDRIWHLHSSDQIREQTRNGAILHLPSTAEVRLLRVPFNPRDHIPLSTEQRDQQQRCRQALHEMTTRQREVLRAFVRGLTPQEVANELSITVKVVDSHKTAIFQICDTYWEHCDHHYHWLKTTFAPFF